MNPQTGKAHVRAARRNGSKAHGYAARGDSDDKTIDGDETVVMDGLNLPTLNDQRSNMKCAVGACASGYSRVWQYASDQRQDPRRICQRCARKWPDVIMHYPAEKVVFDEGNKPARVQAALRQVHGQLVQRVRQLRQRAHPTPTRVAMFANMK